MLIGVPAVSALPFALWGVLFVVARVWQTNLRSTLPCLRVLRWLTWLIGVVFTGAAVLSHRLFWLWPIGVIVTTFSVGLSFAEGWVKRRYAPELLPVESPFGWWPTARK